ncbi:MAG: sterol-binding protein [Alphaproteobacteria bacterium]|nr:MAG: sterol-binding protein [Alphaproteobacteria bacterium]
MIHSMMLKNLPRLLLRPAPALFYRPVLNRIVKKIIHTHPRIFDRLGDNCHKTILVNPTNMPVVFLVKPDPQKPSVRAYKNTRHLHFDASITGSLLTLLRMVDGRLDGDAVFFTRDLQINGDTEAIVSLRNALDDVDGSIADDIAASFGLAGQAALNLMRRIDMRQRERSTP